MLLEGSSSVPLRANEEGEAAGPHGDRISGVTGRRWSQESCPHKFFGYSVGVHWTEQKSGPRIWRPSLVCLKKCFGSESLLKENSSRL